MGAALIELLKIYNRIVAQIIGLNCCLGNDPDSVVYALL